MVYAASILDSLLQWAPASLAWDKDNIGLLVGSPSAQVTSVLVCLDITEAVVDEAIERGADLIVAHHPVIFRPLYSIRTDGAQGRILEKLLRAGIAAIAMHTNADAAPNGLNRALALRLGLTSLKPLDPAAGQLRRIELRLSGSDLLTDIGEALSAMSVTDWHVQSIGGGGTLLVVDTEVGKVRGVTAMLNEHLGAAVVSRRTFALEDKLDDGGIGLVGDVEGGSEAGAFLAHVKERLGCAMLRSTHFEPGMIIRRVAVCGGAGSSYVRAAIAAGAQCLVTGDLTHHIFLDYGGDILLVDAGHFETENVFVELCGELLEKASFQDSEKIDILRVRTNTNPVRFV